MTKLTPIPVYFEGIKSLADGTLRVTFDAQELRPEVEAELVGKRRKAGFLLFLENDEKVDRDSIDIPESAPEFKGDKTPSQRLRGVLFRLWEQLGSRGSFQDFYVGKMEEIANHFKAKLQ